MYLCSLIFFLKNFIGKGKWIWCSIKCWKWNCHGYGWCCAKSTSVELEQRPPSMKCALCLSFKDTGKISACETAWTMKMLATKMSVCITCTNDGALIIYQRSEGTRKKIIYVKEMYLFICSLQFWISFDRTLVTHNYDWFSIGCSITIEWMFI